MYTQQLTQNLSAAVDLLKNEQRFKSERELQGGQGPVVKLKNQEVIMLAANNYLGLANHPVIKKAAQDIVEEYGFGMSSVRFICGTQDLHRRLEKRVAKFLGTEDAMLFSSCFAANEGFFATLINEPFGQTDYIDAVYSDQLNHASIIDALRLVKNQIIEKKVYAHADTAELSRLLNEDKTKNFRHKIIATDGVFSMEGDLAPLPELIKLAQEHQALLFVDDSHGVGAIGPNGKGAAEELNVLGQVDVLSGTLGKALGGAAGGYLAGKQAMIDFLRQKSRPYIFSNSLPPIIAGATLAALDLIESNNDLIKKLAKNTYYFREQIKALGFTIIDGSHPIIPVMLGEAAVAQEMSQQLLANGLYVIGLWFPVVPQGQARLRVQISAAHTKAHLDQALAIFKKVGREMKIIS